MDISNFEWALIDEDGEVMALYVHQIDAEESARVENSKRDKDDWHVSKTYFDFDTSLSVSY